MASIHLQGILVDSVGEIDVGGVITFTHLTTTGDTIASTQTELIIPPDGAYSIDVEYGQIRIDYTTRNTERFVANVIVNSASTATSLPELLSATTPVAKPIIIQMQGLVADATAAATTAEAFADQLTTTELIASSATFAPNTNITTKGYTTSGDGGAGSWIQNGVTGQTVSQSPAQLGNALLNDGSGNQWALVSTGSEISPESIGYQTNQDLTPYLEVAFSYFVSQGRGTLNLGSAAYTMSTQFTHVGGSLNVTIQCKRDATRIFHNSSAAGFLFTGQVNNFHLRGYPDIINNGQKTAASTQAFFVFQSGNTGSSFQADYRPVQLATDADLLAGFYYCAPASVNDTIDFHVNCSGISDAGITLGAGSTVYMWGGRLIGAWKPFPAFASIGLNVTGGMGGLYVMGTDIIQNRINARIAKDTGTSNREIFFSPAILDSSWRALEITDESYVSASGIWAASANDACIYYAPAIDTNVAALVIAGGTIFNAGVNDPSALDGDGVGIKVGANGRVLCTGVYFRNNLGFAIQRIAVGGSSTSIFDGCVFATNATRAGTPAQVHMDGKMEVKSSDGSASDGLLIERGNTREYKVSDVKTETDQVQGLVLTGSLVGYVNIRGFDVIAYIRGGVGTKVLVDSQPFVVQASGPFNGVSVKVPAYSELEVEYTTVPNILLQYL